MQFSRHNLDGGVVVQLMEIAHSVNHSVVCNLFAVTLGVTIINTIYNHDLALKQTN